MKDEKKSIGRRIAGRFSRFGLYTGIFELCALLLTYTVLRHVDARVILIALAVCFTVCEITRALLMIHFHERISRKAFKPLSGIVETVQHITTNNLSERIDPCEGEEELRELINVLNQMLDRVESGYNSQKRFISDASHELRTPIAVIQGYADMLDRWGKSNPDVMEESISAIRTESAGMKELVDQLLFIARHEGNAQPYQMEYFDVSELIDELARDTRLIDSDHTIDVAVNEKCVIRADRAALKQALRIFLDNAIKYTPKGGHIALGCLVEKKNCRLTVADDGPGIGKEELGKIFERFYRAPSARGSSVEGHGLGLSIARLIVRAHAGHIEVQSKLGGGSRFHILLPR